MKEPELETIAKDAKECGVCGEPVPKVFQYNACKGCLTKSFQRFMPDINRLREGVPVYAVA